MTNIIIGIWDEKTFETIQKLSKEDYEKIKTQIFLQDIGCGIVKFDFTYPEYIERSEKSLLYITENIGEYNIIEVEMNKKDHPNIKFYIYCTLDELDYIRNHISFINGLNKKNKDFIWDIESHWMGFFADKEKIKIFEQAMINEKTN